ncbi:hypothetical protein BDZ97DRAFT_750916 [Flammula alnicola]|nr:hypothetical protein BDZ97DRAFT_750916 [Flammula alnicola]
MKAISKAIFWSLPVLTGGNSVQELHDPTERGHQVRCFRRRLYGLYLNAKRQSTRQPEYREKSARHLDELFTLWLLSVCFRETLGTVCGSVSSPIYSGRGQHSYSDKSNGTSPKRVFM